MTTKIWSRPLLTAVLAVCLALGPISVAQAGRKVVIKGGGWGHGIGMSQYGAYGRALAGRGARAILTHYYSRTRVSPRKMPGAIRVGLLQYRGSVGLTSLAKSSSGGDMALKVKGSSGRLARGGPGTSWRVEASSTGGFRLYRNGSQVRRNGRTVFGGPKRPLVAVYAKYGSLADLAEKTANYAYGRIEISSYSSSSCSAGYCLRAIVTLGMQKYLFGLGEVPSSWPQESLRAQAIAGRTYAFAKVKASGQHRYPCGCAVYDSTLDQAYIGDAKRTGSGIYWDDWKSAVRTTRSQVVTSGGAPIQALYSSSSGGHTENNENVWGGSPVPYLRGVKDRADAVAANPNHSWKVQMSWDSFSSKLASYYGTGQLDKLKLLKPFGVSGRVTVPKDADSGGAKVVGRTKTVRTSGWSLRSALGLKDSLFRVAVFYDTARAFITKHHRLGAAPGHALGPATRVPRSGPATGLVQDFQRGRMTYIRATGQSVWQRGPVLAAYDGLGRESSALGLPLSDLWGGEDYWGATYEHGSILYSKDTGAHAVLDDVRPTWRRSGGPEGRLGLPLGPLKTQDGVNVQRFENGTIRIPPSG